MLKGAAIYPPGPKRRLPGAMLLAFRRDPLWTTVNIAREYGDLAHYRIGGFHVYQASNPALIRDVLVVNNSKFIKSPGYSSTCNQIRHPSGEDDDIPGLRADW